MSGSSGEHSTGSLSAEHRTRRDNDKMGMRETIQNRLTNQSAAWAALLLFLTPISQQFQLYEALPPTSIAYTVSLTMLFLLFIRMDKQQEHNKAAALLTEPKYLEQFLDRFGFMIEGFASAITAAKEQVRVSDDGQGDIQ